MKVFYFMVLILVSMSFSYFIYKFYEYKIENRNIETVEPEIVEEQAPLYIITPQKET